MMPMDAAARGRTLRAALDVKDLPASGLRFAEALPTDFLLELLGPAATRGPIRFVALGEGRAEVEVAPLGPEEPPPVRIAGRVAAAFGTTCVRCLEAVRVDLDVPVDASLFPDAEAVPAPVRGKGSRVPVEGGEPLEPWGEAFPDPDRLDDGAYDGVRIPLPELLAQALLIELPTDPVCAETNACDVRTAALIEAANAEARASDAEGDPRWAALRALRAAASEPSGGGSPTGNR